MVFRRFIGFMRITMNIPAANLVEIVTQATHRFIKCMCGLSNSSLQTSKFDHQELLFQLTQALFSFEGSDTPLEVFGTTIDVILAQHFKSPLNNDITDKLISDLDSMINLTMTSWLDLLK